MSLRIQYTLTATDLCEFQRRHPRMRPNAGRAPFAADIPPWLLTLVAIVLGAFLLFGHYYLWHRGFPFTGLLIMDVALIFCLSLALFSPSSWLTPDLKYQLATPCIAIEIDEQQLTLHKGRSTRDRSTNAYGWQTFLHLGESENLLALYYTPKKALLIPKRAFANDQEYQSTRTLIQSLIPPRHT